MAACGGRVCVFVHRTITHYADLAPRGCQCGHELRPASNSGGCLPPGVGAPGKLSYHPRPPTLRQVGSDVCLRGEAGPAAAGMLVPSLPACPQPQPCRAVVCTRPSGAARERPGPRTGNGRSDGLDGVPRTQKCPQARSVPGSPPRTGSPGLARTPWGFSRQDYWSGLPCLPPGDLPNPGPGIKPRSPALHAGLIPGLGRYSGVRNGNHSSIFAWKIPWTEEPGGLQSMGPQSGGDLTEHIPHTHTHTHTHTHLVTKSEAHL